MLHFLSLLWLSHLRPSSWISAKLGWRPVSVIVAVTTHRQSPQLNLAVLFATESVHRKPVRFMLATQARARCARSQLAHSLAPARQQGASFGAGVLKCHAANSSVMSISSSVPMAVFADSVRRKCLVGLTAGLKGPASACFVTAWGMTRSAYSHQAKLKA